MINYILEHFLCQFNVLMPVLVHIALQFLTFGIWLVDFGMRGLVNHRNSRFTNRFGIISINVDFSIFEKSVQSFININSVPYLYLNL